MTQTQPISVAIAIIYQDGKYLMQLRDDLPTIAYPGVWGFLAVILNQEKNQKPP